jgi:hypothetical protein
MPDRRGCEDFAALLAAAVGDLALIARRTLTWGRQLLRS